MHLHPAVQNNPALYEINTRVWIKRFSQAAKLDEVPDEYWHELKSLGFEYIWLMGVWEINKNTIDKYCFEEGLIKEYNEALPDWKREDVIGSPFSIEDYKVSEDLGGEESLLNLKEKLNLLGMKLILDFIPNHFSAESYLLKEKPEIFLRGTDEDFKTGRELFFIKGDHIFAHGKDPYYPSWKDTVQVNYFSEHARKFMMQSLLNVSKLCDGVRCDMAMLIVNSIFRETWFEILKGKEFREPGVEFWRFAINEIKERDYDFLFIAETYWNMEWQLQQLGFDFTYDKSLLDRLRVNDVEEIKNHLSADDDFQKKSVRFIENHDESRAAVELGIEKSKTAAVIMSSLTGMKLYYDGQLEGKEIKLPVQLGREPHEAANEDLKKFYTKLLKITSQNIFKNGSWELLEPEPAWEGGKSYRRMLAWKWSFQNEIRVVVVNYADTSSHCSLRFDTNGHSGEFVMYDELNEVDFTRNAGEIKNIGLYIKLGAYKSHIFSF